MQRSFMVLKNSRGFGLLEVMIAAGIAGGLMLVVMQLNKNSAQTQSDAYNNADYLELKTQVDNMMMNSFDCTASLRGTPFKGSTIKETPVDVELWHGDQNGDRSRKLISGSDAKFNRYGKISISKIKFSMPDYSGGKDFDFGPNQIFKGMIQIEGDKNKMGKAVGFPTITKEINVVFDTTKSGQSGIISCTGKALATNPGYNGVINSAIGTITIPSGRYNLSFVATYTTCSESDAALTFNGEIISSFQSPGDRQRQPICHQYVVVGAANAFTSDGSPVAVALTTADMNSTKQIMWSAVQN
jgi:competence protein ComGC